jgi:hypothetical protein
MLELLVKAGELLPLVIAINVLLAAVGGVFEAVGKLKGSESGPAKLIGQISAGLKKIIDFVSANVAHK